MNDLIVYYIDKFVNFVFVLASRKIYPLPYFFFKLTTGFQGYTFTVFLY